MKLPRLHLPSLLTGLALALLAAVTLGSVAPAPAKVEYRIVEDVKEGEAGDLAADGWEYVGYLGQGTKGSGNDQTLWRHAGK